jgi:hypothetical protein
MKRFRSRRRGRHRLQPGPPTLGNEGREKSRPPGAPETLTPREEHEISKKGEERIARQQAKK